MSLMKPVDFDRSFITPINRIKSNPKTIIPAHLHLPAGTTIHFMADSDQILGIDSNNSLIQNAAGHTYIYHQTHLKQVLGTSMSSRVLPDALIKPYQKSHLNIKRITNLDRALSNESQPIVINYSLLPKLYKYSHNNLVVYQEWFNARATMWDMVNQIGTRRTQFIKYTIPEVLPPKTELIKYSKEFKVGGLSDFYSQQSLNLLELWRMVTPNVDSVDMGLSEEVMDHVRLVFEESGLLFIIKMRDLIDWAMEDHDQAAIALYHFFDYLVGLRAPVNTEAEEEEATSTAPEAATEAIDKLIREQGSVGALSAAEQNRLIKMSHRYKEIKDPHGSMLTLDQMVAKAADLKVERKEIIAKGINTLDDSLRFTTLEELDKKYIQDIMHKDIVQMLLMFQHVGVIVKNITVKRKNTAVTKSETYIVSLQPINGPASTFTFTIPIIAEDGSFLAGAVRYRMDKQKSDLPFIKTKSDTVALSSYYGKLFITRNDSSHSNYSKWIVKELLSRGQDIGDDTVTDIHHGISRKSDIQLPRAFTAVSNEIDSFNTPFYSFVFSPTRFEQNFTEAELKLAKTQAYYPCGHVRTTGDLLVMDEEGIVYRGAKDKFTPLGKLPYLIDEDLTDGPLEYAELSLLNRRIPIVLAMAYYLGLDELLKKLKIKHSLSPTNIRLELKPNEYALKFKDIVYVLHSLTPSQRFLFAGFQAIRKNLKNYKGSDFNKPPVYGSLLNGLGITTYHLREVKLMWDMFVEPISEELLIKMKESTEFFPLLLRANELLMDDFVPGGNTSRTKGYERIPGMIYHQMVLAMRAFRAQGSISNIEVSINPNAVWMDILQDQTVALVEESNPVHNLKEKESITFAGAGGRSAVTMVKSTRGYQKEDLGVVSESTPDSAKVGIRAYLTASPNIDSVRGTTREYDKTQDTGVNVLSTSALLAPSVTHDDSKRVSYISIQNSHAVACENYDARPYRTGYEEVIGARVDELFVVTAKADGEVLNVTDDMLSVKYKDGTVVNYELGVTHGTVSGTTVPHTRITDMVKGQKFKKTNALIFNKGFFKRSELNPANVVYAQGVMARVAFLEDMEVNEDSCVISQGLANKLTTPGTKLHGIIVDFDKAVHNLVKVGQHVDPETILCTLENVIDSDLDSKDREAITALTQLNRDNPKAKTYGTISKVEVLYYGDMDDMSPSLQKLAKEYDSNRSKRITKLMLDDAKTGKIDESIRVANKVVSMNQLVIKVYIDGEIAMTAGDKLVIGNQLKTTCSRVDTGGMRDKEGNVIDAKFSYQSVANRIVGSTDKEGIMNSLMIGLSEIMGKKYKST